MVCGRDDAEVARRAENIGRDVATAKLAHLAGTPQEVVDRIGLYRDAGAQTVYFQVLDLHDLDHLRLLAADVVPAFS